MKLFLTISVLIVLVCAGLSERSRSDGKQYLRSTEKSTRLMYLTAEEKDAADKKTNEEVLKIQEDMDVDFEIAPVDWYIGQPAEEDYFGIFSRMDFALFARSMNDYCEIDMFMTYEPYKEGDVLAYTVAEANVYRRQCLAENVDIRFEYWPGNEEQRIVGSVSAVGLGANIGIMQSRMKSNMGSLPYQNTVYSIVNDKQLLTVMVSAPLASWKHDDCAMKINRFVKSFRVNGPPEPEEKNVLAQYTPVPYTGSVIGTCKCDPTGACGCDNKLPSPVR